MTGQSRRPASGQPYLPNLRWEACKMTEIDLVRHGAYPWLLGVSLSWAGLSWHRCPILWIFLASFWRSFRAVAVSSRFVTQTPRTEVRSRVCESSPTSWRRNFASVDHDAVSWESYCFSNCQKFSWTPYCCVSWHWINFLVVRDFFTDLFLLAWGSYEGPALDWGVYASPPCLNPNFCPGATTIASWIN